ncbi:MAG: addiction module protein [Myxococcota bacterium]
MPEELVSQALKMSEKDRAALAFRLLERLGPESETSDEQWLEALERRAQRIISGESVGIAAETVYQRALMSIGKK